MIALRLHDKRDLRLHEEPVPAPDDDEVLVRVTAVGLCGSDLHWFREGAIGDVVLTPLVLGHEFVGVIEQEHGRASGSPSTRQSRAASARRASPATRTSASPAGSPELDRRRSALPPGLAERLAHRVPDSLPDVEATLLEPLGVALARARPRPPATGDDGRCVRLRHLGLLLVQLLQRAGVDARGDDPLPHRRDAEALGATVAVETRRAGTEILPGCVASGIDVAPFGGRRGRRNRDCDRHAATRRPAVLVGIPADRSCFTASVARRKGLRSRSAGA